ncbi:DUF3592 domain-containing protein [Litoribrevibacter euphylliae]|uniref:DUF3592 domain-containing protein n=1 Tax=Litoribrevibacter euphylliae TaxID=1834034 RepID=A0ABV7HM76_9GAMM
MGAIAFLLVGIFFVFLGRTFWKKHHEFLEKSIEIPGTVKELVLKTDRSRNSGSYSYYAPIVEYYQDKKTYRFTAEVDAQQHYLKIGDSTSVYIDPTTPKVAKLVSSNGERLLMLRIMMGLGGAGIILGIYLLTKNGFPVQQLMSPISWLFAGGIVMLCYKFVPMMGTILNGPIYYENAEEITSGDITQEQQKDKDDA